jgi:hypothetical protein
VISLISPGYLCDTVFADCLRFCLVSARRDCDVHEVRTELDKLNAHGIVAVSVSTLTLSGRVDAGWCFTGRGEKEQATSPIRE